MLYPGERKWPRSPSLSLPAKRSPASCSTTTSSPSACATLRQYHSWSTSAVKFEIDDPAEAHVTLLAKYTDDDIHNLMAYLQTLR